MRQALTRCAGSLLPRERARLRPPQTARTSALAESSSWVPADARKPQSLWLKPTVQPTPRAGLLGAAPGIRSGGEAGEVPGPADPQMSEPCVRPSPAVGGLGRKAIWPCHTDQGQR